MTEATHTKMPARLFMAAAILMLTFLVHSRCAPGPVAAEPKPEFECRFGGENLYICKHVPTGDCFVKYNSGGYAGGLAEARAAVCEVRPE